MQTVEQLKRNQKYQETLQALKIAFDAAWTYPEFTEFNAVIVQMEEFLDDLRARLKGLPSNDDLMTQRLDKFDSIFQERHK